MALCYLEAGFKDIIDKHCQAHFVRGVFAATLDKAKLLACTAAIAKEVMDLDGSSALDAQLDSSVCYRGRLLEKVRISGIVQEMEVRVWALLKHIAILQKVAGVGANSAIAFPELHAEQMIGFTSALPGGCCSPCLRASGS